MPNLQLPSRHTLLFTFVISLCYLANNSLHAQAPIQTIEPTYISVADGLVSSTVRDVMQDSFGLLWIATHNGLQKYDGYRFETFKRTAGKPTSLQHNRVLSLLEDANHDIWVGNGKGVSKYIRKKNEFKNYDFSTAFNFPSDSEVRGLSFFKDSQHRFWVNTVGTQLVQYDSATDKWKRANYEVPNVAEPDHSGVSLSIAEDLKGDLWLASPNYGLMRQAKNENSFKPIPLAQLSGLDFVDPKNWITALFADSTNMLWITTQSGVYKYNPATTTMNTIKIYSGVMDVNKTFMNKILPDTEGNIWVANNYRGILKFDGISDSYTEIEIAGKTKIDTQGWDITLTKFMVDRSGIFWFGSLEAGLVKYDPVDKPFHHLAHDASNPNSMNAGGAYGILASKVKPGITYVGTKGGGVTIYDPKKETFEKIKYNFVDDMFGGSARSIAESKDGSLWLGTWGDGLVELDKNYNEVKRYKYDSANINSISDNKIRAIKPDKQGRLWLGTNNGLTILNPKTGNAQRITSKYTKQYPLQLIAELERLTASDQKIASIERVVNNQNLSVPVEIKTEGSYLVMAVGEIDIVSGADFGWIENEAKDTVWQMGTFERTHHAGGDAKNRIVVGNVTLKPGSYTLRYKTDDSHAYGKWNAPAPDQTSLYGIALIKPQSEDQLKSYQAEVDPEKDELITSGANISDIEVTDKYVWVAAEASGLDRIDPVTNQVKHYSHNPDDANSLSHDNIKEILADSKGMIWLATSEGLSKLDPATETFTNYTEADGLPTNLTEGLVEGDDGEMWIATQNGLSQMVTNEKLNKATFINYNSLDGLGTDTYLSLTNARGTDGRFYFGGEHGLTTFTGFSSNKTPPAIIISNMFISNKSVLNSEGDSPLTTSLQDTKSISLAYDQNSLSFEFAALHYANPKKNQYGHMLKGYDQDWIYDNRNFAAYTNLDPGNYDFMIRASNAYGVWNEKGLTLAITILPPWWRTWWAYASYVVLFAGFAFTTDRTVRRGIKMRERERSRERELKQAKEIEKAYTELKATQSQLIQSEKMASLGELTAGIAHEIQNPLNFVNNFSEVNSELIAEMKEELAKGNIDEAKTIATHIDENEKKIIFHGKRADGIVKGMLQHSRSSSGVKELTDINVLADEYLRLAYHGLRAKDKSFNATMKTDFDETIGNINVVPQDIGRVILNLITNAFYVVSERAKQVSTGSAGQAYEPTVSVSTKKEGSKVLISIKDNGNGIPQKVLDKIFQPFFTTKPTGQGTGLGLSMSYDIVTNAHQGEIKVKTKEGEGTEFSVVLPI